MEDSTDIFIICRICLKDGDMVPIFNTVENSLHVLISDMITLCCGINVSTGCANRFYLIL